ncbi:MAG: OsmC family protein [Gammaproteobacteria bacterium]|nr:OsmC family protein [Gammaproteobacteria bacterium]
MSHDKQFTLELEQRHGYEFQVRLDLEGVDDLLVDEAPPIGQGKGPNPARMLTIAAANCLSSSLLYCITRNEPPPGSLHTTATCTLIRSVRGKLRIGSISVRLQVGEVLEKAIRMKRCLDLFEDFCVVTASLRDAFPIEVEVVDPQGKVLHRSNLPPTTS